MTIFKLPDFDNHEQVSFFHDEKVGLKVIIAIHNTNRGPALGGCRFWNYESDDQALTDVLRLSRGMTYKSALANLNLGGGKAVIIGDPKKLKSAEFFKAFAQCIEKMGGRYITAEDVGTSPEDMAMIRAQTRHVVGLCDTPGGSGDPSIFTAYGTYVGMTACTQHIFKTKDLSGLHVAIQGLGHVGFLLAKLLYEKGATLTVTDINQETLAQAQSHFKATVVSPDDIYDVKCDIFAPCALGGVLNDATIDRLNCSIIAGSANNQLFHQDHHGDRLKEKGILYAPDYLINAGGIINVTFEGPGYDKNIVTRYVDGIYDTMEEILDYAVSQDISTHRASNYIAEQRFLNPTPSLSRKCS